MAERLADAFTEWVASVRGLVQTVLVTVAWFFVGVLWFDRENWWLLFGYTIFSGITVFPLSLKTAKAEQHALSASEKSQAALDRLEQALKNQADLILFLLSQTEAIREDVEDIASEDDA